MKETKFVRPRGEEQESSPAFQGLARQASLRHLATFVRPAGRRQMFRPCAPRTNLLAVSEACAVGRITKKAKTPHAERWGTWRGYYGRMGFNWWVATVYEAGGVVAVGSIVFWVICSITLHELSHGWAAIRQGDDTPILSGHMTWNPLVHMGTMSLMMFALLGYAWGAMPVNPSRFRSRRGEAIVAASGPAMNFAISVVAAVVLVLWVRLAAGHVAPHVYDNVLRFLDRGVGLNLFLMMFNLLPLPPLDGSRILGDFWPGYWRLLSNERAAFVAIIVLILAFQHLAGPVFEISNTLGGMMLWVMFLVTGGVPGGP